MYFFCADGDVIMSALQGKHILKSQHQSIHPSLSMMLGCSSIQTHPSLELHQMALCIVTARGDGVLEVKCPYSKKDVPMETACADPSFYLSTSDQGTQLKENHQYYYQIQTQLHSTKRKYCDFVVWTPSQIHIQRI
jgi:hypothetical protein